MKLWCQQISWGKVGTNIVFWNTYILERETDLRFSGCSDGCGHVGAQTHNVRKCYLSKPKEQVRSFPGGRRLAKVCCTANFTWFYQTWWNKRWVLSAAPEKHITTLEEIRSGTGESQACTKYCMIDRHPWAHVVKVTGLCVSPKQRTSGNEKKRKKERKS